MQNNFSLQFYSFTWLLYVQKTAIVNFDESAPDAGLADVRSETDLKVDAESFQLNALKVSGRAGFLLYKPKVRARTGLVLGLSPQSRP
jgi:hypothetical protein